MWRQLIAVLSFILLLYRPGFASATSTRFAKRQSAKPLNYRCSEKVIFDQKFLKDAAEAAADKFASQLLTEFANSELEYPSIYKGPPIFDQKNALLVWPLSKDRHDTSKPVEPGECFLVLAEGIPFRIVSVIILNSSGTYDKCQLDKNARDSQHKASKIWFKCPSGDFSSEAVQKAVQAVKLHKEKKINKKKKIPGSKIKSMPYRFLGQKILFGYSDKLYEWPISIDGTFYGPACTKLIINRNKEVIGMVEAIYLKTRLCESFMDVQEFIPQDSLGYSKKRPLRYRSLDTLLMPSD